ncbi:MAG: D-alanyl-D-alanine carboxypeptidase, partial [Clostridia bacterium]|nr:D-alanyl-D-alanine carboxypeptidase [Clostridia bacterium]
MVFVLIFSLLFPVVSFGASGEFVWSSDEVTSSVNANASSDGSPLLNLECGGAVLIEQNSGKVLYDHHMHEKLKPASVTKVMTILLIMEALDSGKITLDTQIPCSENARSMGGSQIWLDTRESLTVNEMLKAICVVSANDCTVAMAEYLAGSEEGFVLQMNQKAQALGMKDTTFKNCHGIDEDGHETSAYDISLMSRELLMNHPSITNYTTIWMDSVRDG